MKLLRKDFIRIWKVTQKKKMFYKNCLRSMCSLKTLISLFKSYEKVIWINPVPQDEWEYTQSIAITHQLLEGHMYPLTVKGLEEGMSFLSRG